MSLKWFAIRERKESLAPIIQQQESDIRKN